MNFSSNVAAALDIDSVCSDSSIEKFNPYLSSMQMTQNTSSAVGTLLSLVNLPCNPPVCLSHNTPPSPEDCKDRSEVENVFNRFKTENEYASSFTLYQNEDVNDGDDISFGELTLPPHIADSFACVDDEEQLRRSILCDIKEKGCLELNEDERKLFNTKEGINDSTTERKKINLENRLVETIIDYGGSLSCLFETKEPLRFKECLVQY